MTCRDCGIIEAEIEYVENSIIYWSLMEEIAYETKYGFQQQSLALNIEWAECCGEETRMVIPVKFEDVDKARERAKAALKLAMEILSKEDA